VGASLRAIPRTNLAIKPATYLRLDTRGEGACSRWAAKWPPFRSFILGDIDIIMLVFLDNVASGCFE
jgi:hypothetical protein